MELSLRAVSLRYGPVYVLLFLSSESCVFLCILHVFTGTCVVTYVSVACKHVHKDLTSFLQRLPSSIWLVINH